VFGKLNPVMVQGAVLADMMITEGWSTDAVQAVKTGDIIRIDPEAKTIIVRP
jgi:predicted aconitase with swiveling domain